ADATGNERARTMASALDVATTQYLLNDKAPSRKAGELDNRGTHFYLALYWARALAEQTDDAALASKFAPVASALGDAEAAIVEELNSIQGSPVDIGGYFHPDPTRAAAAMRPSARLNAIID